MVFTLPSRSEAILPIQAQESGQQISKNTITPGFWSDQCLDDATHRANHPLATTAQLVLGWVAQRD